MTERRRFSDKWGKHELDVLAVLSSAFPQWLTSRQIAQRVKAYADSYGELADQAAKAAFSKQFQRDRAKLASMGIAIESRQPEYSSKSDGQDFASYRLQIGEDERVRIKFDDGVLPVLAAANYLARSIALSSALQSSQENTSRNFSRTAPRVPQTPVPGLGLDAIAPGLGVQKISEKVAQEINKRPFTAIIEEDNKKINIAYSDVDDLAMYLLEHPNTHILEPQEAIDAFKSRLNDAKKIVSVEEYLKSSRESAAAKKSANELADSSSLQVLSKKTPQISQTGTEIDRRLRLMLFLAANVGEEFTPEYLADKFIGPSESVKDGQKNKRADIINKDVSTLCTVSDDAELAGSQFFEIDWNLYDTSNKMISTTNSLGLERLAGVSKQYLQMLMASVIYLKDSQLLTDDLKPQAEKLLQNLSRYEKIESVPSISLTHFEQKPPFYDTICKAIEGKKLLEFKYVNSAGKSQERLCIPVAVNLNENGNYYVYGAVEFIEDYVPEELRSHYCDKDASRNPYSPKDRFYRDFRLSRFKEVRIVDPSQDINEEVYNNNKKSEFDGKSFEENAQKSRDVKKYSIIINKTDTNDRVFDFAKRWKNPKDFEKVAKGTKVCFDVVSDSWFVALCISHANNIVAVDTENIREQIIERAENELEELNNRAQNLAQRK